MASKSEKELGRFDEVSDFKKQATKNVRGSSLEAPKASTAGAIRTSNDAAFNERKSSPYKMLVTDIDKVSRMMFEWREKYGWKRTGQEFWDEAMKLLFICQDLQEIADTEKTDVPSLAAEAVLILKKNRAKRGQTEVSAPKTE